MGGFRDLLVWQKGKQLAVAVYRLTMTEPFSSDWGLRDQMRRAAVSVPSNIAEGDEKETNRESVRSFYIAKGSLAELMTQLEIAHEIGYISTKDWQVFEERSQEIGRMLGAIIKARKAKIAARTHSSNS